jgi:glycine oxidase
MNRAADVIVVGAGVIGLAVAYELSRRGARVRVLDARGEGQGASQASAGMLAPHTENLDQPPLWRLGVRSLDLYDGFVDGVCHASHLDIEYRRCGSLHVGTSEAQMEDLRGTADRLKAAGVSCELLTAALVRELEPRIAGDVAGGVLVPDHGYVAVSDLMRAMSAAGSAGGMRVDVERVLRVGASASGVRVETQTEVLHAPAVVVAAGSWTSRVAVEGDAALPVRPVRGQLVQLDWPVSPLARIVWGSDCYLVPWTTGALLVGATVEDAGFDERATTAGVHDLLASACDLLPSAWQAGFLGVRVGLRPATPDGLPVVGASLGVPGVYYATGHYRNGVLLAPITAVLLADLVLGQGEDSALASFAPGRFTGVRS